MGRGTQSDICKNVVEVGAPSFLTDHDDGLEVGTDIGNGWKITEEAAAAGRASRLYAQVATDGTHSVMLINESEYEHVGEHEWTAFGDKRADVEAFVAAFSLTAEIRKSDTVNQTL
jgi:hypothetical protein